MVMLLIPEQIKFLRNAIRSLEEEVKEYKSYFEELEFAKTDKDSKFRPIDRTIEDRYQLKLQQLEEYKQILRESSYVREIPTDEIGIGTKFKICFDDIGTCEYILVDSMIGSNMSLESVTLNSILGQTVLGKKEGDSFSYRVNSNCEEISGVIEEICKKNEINFIRSRRANHRKGEITTKEIAAFTERIGERVAAAREYDQQIPITESQVELLQEELERLTYLKNSNIIEDKIERRTLSRRIIRIQNMLKDRKIAPLVEDDAIGIGSIFSIMLFENDRTVIKRVELIGKAYSDELDDEYIEKISALGTSIFGLHNNDEFVYHKGSYYITGKVYDIDNSKENRITDPLEYQKKMKRKIS